MKGKNKYLLEKKCNFVYYCSGDYLCLIRIIGVSLYISKT